MKNIVDITVVQTRLFPPDVVPFSELRVPSNAAVVREAFKFGTLQIDPFGLQIIFANGIFQQRGKSANVLSLVIEQRKITIQIRARSATADAFYAAVAKVLKTMSGLPAATKIEPTLKAEDTTCVASLDIDFGDLIAEPLWRLIQKDVKEKLRTDYGTPNAITFKNLSFEIKYETEPQLSEQDVSLSNKLLTIEPRLGAPLSERRFFTASPTDSETHLAILEAIEKEAAKARK